MNALKWLGVVVVFGLTNTTVRSEDKEDTAKSLIGKWEVTKAEEGTVPLGSLIEFTKDGKIMASFKKDGEEMKLEGTYKLVGDTLTVTMKVGEEEKSNKVTVTKISAKEMTLKDDKDKLVELKKL